MKNQAGLLEKRCKPCLVDAPALTQGQVRENIKELHGWTVKNKTIEKTFLFENGVASKKKAHSNRGQFQHAPKGSKAHT